MVERPTYKVGFLDLKKRFAAMPEQPAGRQYGVVWDMFGKDERESCYAVEFVGKTHIAILGYISVAGEAYKTCRPVRDEPLPESPDLELLLDDEAGDGGAICVRGADGKMHERTRFIGNPKRTMREDADVETWNSTRDMVYGEFMASMFLRYVVFADDNSVDIALKGAGGAPTTVGPKASERMTLVKLPEPVEILAGFDTTALPDAIETLLYRVDRMASPSGIERYAAMLMREIDLPRLRTIAAKSNLQLAHISRSHTFYLNFDRSLLDRDEVDALLAVEARLNRLLCILERVGAGLGPVASSPSFEDCSRIDQLSLTGVSQLVDEVLEHASANNPWSCPGTVECQPGGEWDIRTRFAHMAESINVLTRLDYSYRARVTDGVMLVRFGKSQKDCMPRRIWSAAADAWFELDEQQRSAWVTEHDARVAFVLAATCFAAGSGIARVYVQTCVAADDGRGDHLLETYAFDRAEFMAECVPLACEAVGKSLEQPLCASALEAHRSEPPLCVAPDDAELRPRDDSRELPPALRDLLLADRAEELEVMEETDDPYTARIVELREQLKLDREGAYEGLSRLIEELEAKCAVAELMADGPVQSQFCENQLVRLVLPVLEEDRNTRILRVPDALYFAQYEIVNLYAEADDFESALPEARKLYDLARSSMQAHFVLINVLAHLERYDEIIEVARHGLRVAWDRESIGYLFYRLAFAYWNCEQPELALACYRLVPKGEQAGATALEEMQGLMNEMGVTEQPTFEAAVDTIKAAGMELPPVSAVSAQIADAAVQLVDNGFFFLAIRCIYQMWRTMGNDELGALNRSLG